MNELCLLGKVWAEPVFYLTIRLFFVHGGRNDELSLRINSTIETGTESAVKIVGKLSILPTFS